MRLGHSVLGLSIEFMMGSIYLAGASVQTNDPYLKLQEVTYATILFYPAAIILAIVMVALLMKKKNLKSSQHFAICLKFESSNRQLTVLHFKCDEQRQNSSPINKKKHIRGTREAW